MYHRKTLWVNHQRDGDCVRWWMRLKALTVLVVIVLFIHSVDSKGSVEHNDNIAQESLSPEVRVIAPPGMPESMEQNGVSDEDYSYLAGRDLMADETSKGKRYLFVIMVLFIK